MDVHDRLACVPPDVNSDVVSRWLQRAIDPLARGSDELQNVADLGRSEIEDRPRRVDDEMTKLWPGETG